MEGTMALQLQEAQGSTLIVRPKLKWLAYKDKAISIFTQAFNITFHAVGMALLISVGLSP
ncbi:hypothetical protein BT96DRAFT_1023563 [Gymnopus androsaceus JB14]|uniref:Uncharacterized protein n=2 Tax=Gymnopus androsaceus JB14 TaxID=1447944 RepID=A0A6A4H420_9AGAR|nr:hypothetical protein BT96DRAFT_1023563 [Gymnopus androsaceus JB14]